MKRTTPLRRTPLRRVSKKRATEIKVYAKLRLELLAAFPICQVCNKAKATQCHHKAKRGANYLNPETYAAVCVNCHSTIHSNPSWARANGWLA